MYDRTVCCLLLVLNSQITQSRRIQFQLRMKYMPNGDGLETESQSFSLSTCQVCMTGQTCNITSIIIYLRIIVICTNIAYLKNLDRFCDCIRAVVVITSRQPSRLITLSQLTFKLWFSVFFAFFFHSWINTLWYGVVSMSCNVGLLPSWKTHFF